MKQEIADFESAIQSVCEEYREKLCHAEMMGVLDTVKAGYHIRTIQNFDEMCETPVINGEQAQPRPEPMKKLSGSPIPVET